MKKFLLVVSAFFLIAQSGFTQSLTQANFTSVMCPQFMGSGTSTRLPIVFRATLTNLTPSSIYRFYIQAAIRSDIGGSNSGAGNPLFISGNPYKYSTGPGLQTAGGYDSVTTDASGTCTAWFAYVNTGNARFTAGNFIFPTITMRRNNDTTAANTIRRALNDSIQVLAFATAAGANNGTGVYGISSANPRNFISLYDNVGGTGSPLAITFVEATGLDAVALPSLVTYYNDSVITRNGRWGNILPNTLPNGVRRINVHSAANGNIVNFSTDADGIWPSGANTVNPSGGTTAIRLTNADAPLTIINKNITAQGFQLSQNYPNPFNPETNIQFQIPKNGFVSLKVYNNLGMEVSTLINKNMISGTYEVMLNGNNMNSGIYFYTLSFTSVEGKIANDTKKLILVK